jgi:CRISPR-associated protein (TIGR03986 family)
VPEDLKPCRDPESLCPACRIFGSADPQARGRDDRAAQRAYAGHVRFGDACSPGPVELEQIWRAPLGAPRPGAGQFYLAYEDRSPARRDRRPTREWGADPDVPDRRRLRGRKFYWHASPQEQHPPRHIARDHQRKAKLVTQRWIAPPGTILTQKISFDNLSPADLGGLLAVFNPGRVLPTGDAPPHLHLGGGKPLGLGSCTASVSDLQVWDAASRYGGGQQPQRDEDSWVGAFREACRPEVTATWPALAAVLTARGQDAPYVWYPPGASWSARSDAEKTFDEPFAFFTASSGMFLADGKRELIPLPDPGQADQSLRIVPKDGPT